MDRDERKQLRAITDDVERVGRRRSTPSRTAPGGRRRTATTPSTSSVRASSRCATTASAAWRAMPADARRRPAASSCVARQCAPAGALRPTMRMLWTADRRGRSQRRRRRQAAVVGARRFFAGSKKDARRPAAADLLSDLRDWATAVGSRPRCSSASHARQDGTTRPSDDRLPTRSTDWVGLADASPIWALARAASPARGRCTLPAVDRSDRPSARSAEARSGPAAMAAGEAVRRAEVRRMLRGDAGRATQGRDERPAPHRSADRRRHHDRRRRSSTAAPHLDYLPGIGATTATRMRRRCPDALADHVRRDAGPDRHQEPRRARRPNCSDRLARLGRGARDQGATADLARSRGAAPLAYAVRRTGDATSLVLSCRSRAVAELPRRGSRSSDGGDARHARPGRRTVASSDDPWDDFLARPADYFAMLAELGFLTEDEQKTHGDLPDEIVEAVRALELNTEHLTASLRGYQSFGARFALVQRKVIIGDEMGLGKTVEALAVLAHLRAKGAHHFLVVCPAAVVTNWIREVASEVDAAAAPGPRAGPRGAPPGTGCATAVSPSRRTRRSRWLEASALDQVARSRLRRRRRGALHQEPGGAALAAGAGAARSAPSEPSSSPARRWRTASRSSATSSATSGRTSSSTPASSPRGGSAGRSRRPTCAATRKTCSPSFPNSSRSTSGCRCRATTSARYRDAVVAGTSWRCARRRCSRATVREDAAAHRDRRGGRGQRSSRHRLLALPRGPRSRSPARCRARSSDR